MRRTCFGCRTRNERKLSRFAHGGLRQGGCCRPSGAERPPACYIKSGCRWCECPPEYGPPGRIYNRFVRWAERGGWERWLQEFVRRGRATGTQMIDSPHISADCSASGGKGGQARAIGRSRGGRNSKIHATADARGRLLSLTLTGGEAHDYSHCRTADQQDQKGTGASSPTGL